MNPLKDNLHGFNSSVDNRPPKRRKFIHGVYLYFFLVRFKPMVCLHTALHSVSVESLPDWDSPLIAVNNPLPGPSYWPQSNQAPPGRTEILDRRGSTSKEPHILSVEDNKGPSAANPSSPSLSSHQTPPLEIFPDKVYPSSGFLNARQLDKLDLNAKTTSQPSKVKNLGIPKTIQVCYLVYWLWFLSNVLISSKPYSKISEMRRYPLNLHNLSACLIFDFL